MYLLRKALFVVLAISLLFPISQADDSVYRVDGLPENLHFATGASYEMTLTASNYSAISAVNITVTNGTLSETSEFTAEVHQLILSSSNEGWTFHWQAPSESFELGEGEAELAIVFENQDGGIWSTYNSVLRPPEIEAHDEAGVPEWALSLAWTGASLTVLLTIIGAIVLRRDRLT
ncbi:MAG: hypothetical protein VYE50_02475 [Candidatus Thermoplasmatota archaeon]|jgi:hypothetical protein|nr:hypothetical protein [Candidatus Thermoplasmatota archaeon]MEC8997149.1 hypothetical protein [Candidatus Thermoplasmatota archaeon]MED6305327.1 hypothetical protein [Candidatus Thermoplasmatota archaeon]MEE3242583.1 hypothetical protein [Candidatus Thermoplasmatota archaeon]